MSLRTREDLSILPTPTTQTVLTVAAFGKRERGITGGDSTSGIYLDLAQAHKYKSHSFVPGEIGL